MLLPRAVPDRRGTIDKFATWSGGAGMVMGYWNLSDLPLYKVAQEYTLADHFFHAAFGGSFLNHQWLILRVRGHFRHIRTCDPINCCDSALASRQRRTRLRTQSPGIAIGLAIGSHLVLDLATHLPDMQLAPGIDSIRLGSGLYRLPPLAFVLASTYGIACRRMFGGSWRLLAAIVIRSPSRDASCGCGTLEPPISERCAHRAMFLKATS